jgi:tRNA threonylcarbamoyladenosine dehydratase
MTTNNIWYSRTELLVGEEKLSKIRDSHILIVGLGGVGAYAAEQLCRAGIGKMTIVDADNVDITNINRQLPALHSNIEKAKTEVLSERFKDINPEIEVIPIKLFLKDQKIPDLLNAAKYDYVVDAIDSLSPKAHLLINAKKLNYNIVSSMGAGGKFDPSQIRIADISKSYNCGLARALRKKLHRNGIYKGIKVIFSPEERTCPVVQDNSGEVNNTVVGTISYMPAIFGCFCASVVINELIS